MPAVRVMDWIANYRGFIGRLTDTEASDWLQAIQNNIPNVRQEELDRAVAALCGMERPTHAAKPGAWQIIQRIKADRGQRSTTPNTVTTASASGTGYTTMQDLKASLSRKPDPEAAWDLICTPADSNQCAELRQYADQHGIQYTRPRLPRSYINAEDFT